MNALRPLKYIAMFLVILLAVTLLFVGYFFLTANVSIAAFKAQGVPTSQVPEQFAELKAAVQDKTFQGTLFGTPTLGEAEDYALITYTLRLSNQCLVPIDMIEVQVVPEPTDILQLGDSAVHSLGPKSQGDITATILVPKDSHTVRELIVTYYVWGVSFSLKEVYSGR
jgi:hypothetical protein